MLQIRLLDELHVAHPGIVRMKALARFHVWWPGLDKSIETTVRLCGTCQSHRNKDPPVPVTAWPYPAVPWSRLHADFAGPMDGKMYLIITDAHSKWLEVIAMATTSSKATIVVFNRLFAAYGLPNALVADNGTQFTSQEWADFIIQNGVVHMTSVPYFLATNGTAERNVQTLKAALLRETATGTACETALQTFLTRYHATPHATTGKTPAALFLGREVRTRLNLLKPTTRTRLGSKSELVKLDNGVLARRHLDQLRVRHDPQASTPTEKEVVPQDVRSRSTRARQRPARYDD